MRYSGLTERGDDEPWFRLGQLEVTTTVLVLLVWAATLVVFIVEPIDKPVQAALALLPDDVQQGEVWRIVTWPWSHAGFDLWTIIDAALFWLFGTELERQTGRRSFTALIASSILVISLAATAWSAVIDDTTVIADLRLLELTLILLYCAEHPRRPFFFGIPAWAIGGVIVALEVINDLAYKEWVRLLTIIVAAFFIAIVARRVGLLSTYDRIPDLRLPGRRRGGSGAGRRDASAGPSFSGRGSSGAPKERGRSLWGKRGDAEPAEIVEMPQAPRRSAARTIPSSGPELSADDLALDALLDKIADGGLDALSTDERRQLDELRERRRPRP